MTEFVHAHDAPPIASNISNTRSLGFAKTGPRVTTWQLTSSFGGAGSSMGERRQDAGPKKKNRAPELYAAPAEAQVQKPLLLQHDRASYVRRGQL
ncbi:hypothetical protein [Sphingobium tyrosinilyticum]|uniref:Uncharacterized protein n=1 Tax=Sphingobium tyrosinilyticum TaxID=2715436 RepID=A0ABV9F4K6_9SPHN